MSNNSRNKKSQNNNRVSLSREERRLQQLESVLDEILSLRFPADAQLSRWFRQHPKLGLAERGELAESLFEILRNLRLFRHFAQSGEGPMNRRLGLLGLRHALGDSYIQGMLSETEHEWLERIDHIDLQTLPAGLRYSFPDWLAQKMQQLDNAEQLMQALNQKAPLDIRVNPLKLTRNDLIPMLDAEKAEYEETRFSPWGIRLKTNPALNRWDIFQKGLIEVQDEGSQLLCALVSPKKGEMVIDFCAGAGGKTLLLGALMRSTGRLYALDVSGKRLAKAKPRLARAGLSNVSPILIRDENDPRVKRLAGKAHRVLVDAPCSGMGTLRRNPDLKWRQTLETVQELAGLQARILNSAARCVAPGGRLVYCSCSVLPEENEEQVKAFLESHADFELLNAAEVLGDRASGLEADPQGFLKLRPDVHETDGFFATVLQRKAQS